MPDAEAAGVGLACDPRTQAYAARRTAEGKTRKEIMRCLKRYIAREIYKALVTQARIHHGVSLQLLSNRCALQRAVQPSHAAELYWAAGSSLP